MPDDRPRFGTAGLRARVGDGPGELHTGVVRAVADGWAAHLLRTVPDVVERGVVVGGDARTGSAEFTAEVAARLVRAGIPVHAFAGPVPTPLVAGAVRRLDAAGAAMVTASHNPPADNGIKLYGEDGVLVGSPEDVLVDAAIDRAVDTPPAAAAAPAHRHGLGDGSGDHPVVTGYLRDALALAGPPGPQPLRVTTTALHGVGGALLGRLLDAAGVVHASVATQEQPDARFPTVALPNPEEPGTLDLLLEQAAVDRADLALANDPDADRLAVAVRTTTGTHRVLTGDETGAVLAAHVLASAGTVERPLVATTLVSSSLVPRMARAAGAEAVVTPTGFKWLCRAALDRPGTTQLLAYEEALGYAVGPAARDKDGIATALVVVRAVEHLCARHRTSVPGEAVDLLLDELALEHGAHATANGSLRTEGDATAQVAAQFGRGHLAGAQVEQEDEPAPGVLRWWLDDGTRVVLRPSGTEPKLKYYCEAVVATGPAGPGAARAAADGRAAEVAGAVRVLLGG